MAQTSPSGMVDPPVAANGQALASPSGLAKSPFPKPSPQGTPEALPYPILRRMSSTCHSHAALCSAWLRGCAGCAARAVQIDRKTCASLTSYTSKPLRKGSHQFRLPVYRHAAISDGVLRGVHLPARVARACGIALRAGSATTWVPMKMHQASDYAGTIERAKPASWNSPVLVRRPMLRPGSSPGARLNPWSWRWIAMVSCWPHRAVPLASGRLAAAPLAGSGQAGVAAPLDAAPNAWRLAAGV